MSVQARAPRPRKLSEEERVLWEGVARAIAPLRGRGPSSDPPSSPTIGPKAKSDLPSRAPRPKMSGITREPSLGGLDRRQRQRLARGTQPIEARLDLHGRTQAEAHAALLRFLRGAQMRGAKFALVITGKGSSGSGGESGVIKRQVPLWLNLPEFRPYVVGFETAHPSHGGQGAFYLRLRRPRRMG